MFAFNGGPGSSSIWLHMGILGPKRVVVTDEGFTPPPPSERVDIEPDSNLSDLYKDVFLYHWREESQHAVLDEIEWNREHARLDAEARDRGVDDLIALVGAVDGILQAQSPPSTGRS